MIRRDFIKYCFGTLSAFCLTGNLVTKDYYYDKEDLNICLGEYLSHTIEYDLDKPKNFYLGESIYCRYITFPKEFKLKIIYSLFTIHLTSFNINLNDILEILSKKPQDLVTDKHKLILNCKNGDYTFLVNSVWLNEEI